MLRTALGERTARTITVSLFAVSLAFAPNLLGATTALADEAPTSEVAAADAQTLDGILASIERDFSDTTANLQAQKDAVTTSMGDSYEGYVASKDDVYAWLDQAVSDSDQLYVRTRNNILAYCDLVVTTMDNADTAAMSDAVAQLYDKVNKLASQYQSDVQNAIQGMLDGLSCFSNLPDPAADWETYRAEVVDMVSVAKKYAEAAGNFITSATGFSADYVLLERLVEPAFGMGIYDVDAILGVDEGVFGPLVVDEGAAVSEEAAPAEGATPAEEAATETAPAEATTDDPLANATMGQKNALSSAQNYLSFMPFSYTGLIDQLEFEGYTTEEATWAADMCGADWNEQAVQSAQNYLSFMSFSREGLINQLEFGGFTAEQAEYAATAVGY